jgi:integrase/recombinase XerC
MSPQLEIASVPALLDERSRTIPAVPETDLIEAWLEGRQLSTIAGYRHDLEHFARFVAEHSGHPDAPALPVGKSIDLFFAVPAGHANGIVLAYRNHQLAAGLASATIARRLAAVKSIVKVARTLGRINWTIEVQSPRHEDRRDMSGPTDSDRKKLMKALKGRGETKQAARDRALYALCFTMALRRSEVVGLDLADVDFAAGTLSVTRKGKREKAARPIPPNAARALGEWIVARGRHDGPLFTRVDREGNTRLSGEAVRLVFERLGKEAGLAKSIRPHGLRHAAITRLRSLGETDRDVMALSGHSDPKMLGRYDDRKKEGASKMSRKLDSELG